MKLVRTITKLNEQLKKERVNAPEEGTYGLKECRKSIQFKIDVLHETLDQIYVELVKQALTDGFFNTYMIVACEQMMEEAKK